MPATYPQRRTLRQLEKTWMRLEAGLARWLPAEFNPLYHLGTISIFLLIVLTVTGVYLTLFYRPGADAAYASVEALSANWLGSLMRGVHRYASDLMIVSILLHALKMLLADRFWGPRWLAWVSGWLLLLLTWATGTMGYWMVWDARAQWMTEYLMQVAPGATGLTFTTPNLAATTFSVFVIILFLHVFIPLAMLGGVLVHGIRLARARWWAPRWLMLQLTLILAALALLRPALSAAPVDLSRMVQAVPLDLFYLGFLPLVDRLGNLPFLALNALGLALVFGLPWLGRGADAGPALVTNSNCSGCALCAQECPYDAIKVGDRNDTERFRKLAYIDPNLCTGCGLCVGTCATAGVEMRGLPTALVSEGLRGALTLAQAAGRQTTVLFTCQRQQVLFPLAEAARRVGLDCEIFELPLSPSVAIQLEPPVAVHPVAANPGAGLAPQVILAALPCVGMMDVDWVRELWAAGADDVVVLACPLDDCIAREGPLWTLSRLRRRPALLTGRLHYLEAAPGWQQPLLDLLRRLHNPQRALAEGEQPNLALQALVQAPASERRAAAGQPVAGRLTGLLAWLSRNSPRGLPQLRHFGLGLLLLALATALAFVLEWPASAAHVGQSGLRLAVYASGKIETSAVNPDVVLPPGVNPEQVFGGSRFPLQVRLYQDGQLILDETYTAGGLRQEGRITHLSQRVLTPGAYRLRIEINDDATAWRTVFDQVVDFEANQVYTLAYDEAGGRFILR